MTLIKPFKALRPQPQFAKQVASRPYDVLNSAEAKIEAQGNPASFLHITKSEIDLDASIDIHSAAVYENAKQNLDAFIKREILFQESKECYYIYQLIMNGRSQTGVVAVNQWPDKGPRLPFSWKERWTQKDGKMHVQQLGLSNHRQVHILPG